jgi:sterol desaturase/sphingolipid hydroxylase (fatty acid hydroxylase superfamily)
MRFYRVTDEQDLRFIAFLSIISLVILWEFIQPKRKLSQNKAKRWFNNISLVAMDSLIVRLLLPLGAVGVASWAEQNQIGLLQLLHWNETIGIILAMVLLDMIIYWQHRFFHKIPVLWRLHQVHHADRDIDVSTGLRFHPIEILISMLIKFAAILLLGAPVIAVVLFEVILNGMAMFNHGNLKLPKTLDSLLRIMIVTPDMHRVHHSILKHETNSNYGFNISLWDRFFDSYHAQPDLGHHNMVIGLEQYQNEPTHSILWMLRLPFISNGGEYAQHHGSLTQQKTGDKDV